MNKSKRIIIIPPQHLGHEIHIARCIAIKMIENNFINPSESDLIITGIRERKFLYDAIFSKNNVFSFDEIPDLNLNNFIPRTNLDYLEVKKINYKEISFFNDFDVVDLSDYCAPGLFDYEEKNSYLLRQGYNIKDSFYSDGFCKTAQLFNLYDQSILDKFYPNDFDKFIIIHHRYEAKIHTLIDILNSLPNQFPKIIFTSNFNNIIFLNNSISNLFFTSDLKMYASLLKDKRCKCLISEWSGGGQLAQYLLEPQGTIYYYYDFYKDVYNYCETYQKRELLSKVGTIFDSWDFKNISGCRVIHLKDFTLLLNILGKIDI